MAPPALYLALVHYPVYNKRREVVTTALTSIDLHDIARSAKTYGLRKAFFILPSPSQRELAHRIMRHWLSGYGASYNPTRGEALQELAVVESLGDTVEAVERAEGER
ncbi:MAG: RNA methyltransferase, partial [Nitrospinota bacterium]